jgi:hypothetical protein
MIDELSFICGLFNVFIIYILIAFSIPNLSINERVYMFLFLFVINWIMFLNCNTYDVDTNKFNILENMPKQYIPEQMLLKDYMNVKTFPILAKPVICTKAGKGIVIFKDKFELNRFVHENPKLIDEYMIQSLVQEDVELGVLVEKFPFQRHVIIKSITEKLSMDTVRPHCLLFNCKERRDLIPYIEPIIQELSRKIPYFNVGRYDIKTSEEKIKRGEFKVLEINGTMGFDLRGWTTTNPFKCIYYHERWFLKRVIIGWLNIHTLKGYNPVTLIYVMIKTFINMFVCFDWEKLFTIYS